MRDSERNQQSPIGNPQSLPHAYPFLLVDRVLALEQDHWAVALKGVTRNDLLVDACGELPPVLLAEIMAQAAGLAVAPSESRAPGAVLVRIDRFRCRPPIVPGDQLLVTVRVVRQFGGSFKVRAAIRVAGRRCAAAEITLHFPFEGVRALQGTR